MPTQPHRRVGILGGGISGIALAAHLDADVDVLEKRARIGGLSGSVIDQGFTFDAAGPHIMFSKNKDVLKLMVDVLGDNVHQGRRDNKIYFKGRMVKYPFENDLASLAKEDTFECLIGYINNPRAGDANITNLADWSYKTFGAGISDKYFIPYNRKIWNYDPKQIGLEFVSRIPKPPMEDVVKSAIGIPTEGYLHQLHFFYPIEGGYESVVHAFAKRVKGTIKTNWPVTEIEWIDEHWHVRASNGEERLYHELVSTIPIHELMQVWPAAPKEAREALAKLRYNSLINVLLGFGEDRGYTYTAIYVPDPDIPFHRVSFPKNFSEKTVPPGQSAAMAEITANAGDGVWELSDEEITTRVVRDLERMGLIDAKTITYKRVIRFQYGYPVYDLDYRKNVTQLRESVENAGVRLLGRFAQFDYINSDVCVERALALAEQIG